MFRRVLLFTLIAAASMVLAEQTCEAQAPANQRAYGQNWGHTYNTHDWETVFTIIPTVLLPAELLGQRVLPQQRQPLLPLPTRDAHPGLQPHVAKLLPAKPSLPQRASVYS